MSAGDQLCLTFYRQRGHWCPLENQEVSQIITNTIKLLAKVSMKNVWSQKD